MLKTVVFDAFLLVMAFVVATMSISGRRAQPIVQPFYTISIALMATQLGFGLALLALSNQSELLRLSLCAAVDSAIMALVVITLLLTIGIPLMRNQPIAFTPSINAHQVSKALVCFLGIVAAYLIYDATTEAVHLSSEFARHTEGGAADKLKLIWTPTLLLSLGFGAAISWLYLNKVEPRLLNPVEQRGWQD